LANEQAQGGVCDRCGTPVEQRRIAQWFFKITKYAERLLANLEHIDWSEKTKKAQVNWIGRSEGALLRFPVVDAAGKQTGTEIEVYTTRPDTVFGATYVVLSPEHPLVDVVTEPGLAAPVWAYVEKAKRKDLVTRQKIEKVKTGVSTGGRCRNPATGELIPIWVADYVLMDYGTGAIMAVPGHDQRDFEFARQFELPIRRVVAGPGEDADTPLEAPYVGPGRLVSSGPFDGTDVSESVRVVTQWAAENGWGEPRVNFRLHDWCISRQRYWGPPIPIVYCDDCGAVPVPESELPVLLPRVEDFTPDDSGVSPLARVEEWYRTSCPKCGAAARRETDVSDTFLDSGWYFLRYPSTDFDDRPFDPELTRKWLPVDTYIGGHEHAVLHLLYSRFLTMVLHDLGHLDFEEPYDVFRAHGLIIAEGMKMSKSRGNVIVPDPLIEKYGADTLRTYLMFLGPFEEGGDYRQDGIQGPHGFLHRMWDTVASATDADPDPEVERKVHQTIKQVTEQIPALQYNTAIAALMECLNRIRAGGRTAARAEIEPLVPLLAPFAPHIAEELWERLGHEGSIFDAPNWPSYDEAKAAEVNVTIAVQVNGKLRASIEVPRGAPEDVVVAKARAEENVRRHLDGAERRVVYVPDRLVNFVVG
ncbi:MAG TPA: class I tRNA ligase family protein, partial [Longimicrobiales bacterium]|nr:class I tRNA ligase family protein [Longimicrobiales bacterium]